MLTKVILLVAFAASVSGGQIHDTCNGIVKYMGRKSEPYDQKYSAEPDTELRYCGSGPTCCNAKTEELFFIDNRRAVLKSVFYKDPYVTRMDDASTRLGTFMTQSLTLLARNASRTSVLVDAYLEASADENVSVDPMAFAKSVLLDIAESHGVNGLSETPECIAELRDILLPLAGFQIDGLRIAHYFKQAIPEGSRVLGEMKHQGVSDQCVAQLVRSNSCNQCLDRHRYLHTCKPYCMEITKKCLSHIVSASEPWEEYARLTIFTKDKLEKYTKVYEVALEDAIRKIFAKMQDPEIADMCGYDDRSNLVVRNKRAAPKPMLVDLSFLEGMMGRPDELYCHRSSVDAGYCWNGTDTGPFIGSSDDIEMTNNANVTAALQSALAQLATFNQEYRKVESIKVNAIQYNTKIVTEKPEFVIDEKNGNGNVQILAISIGLFVISVLLH